MSLDPDLEQVFIEAEPQMAVKKNPSGQLQLRSAIENLAMI